LPRSILAFRTSRALFLVAISLGVAAEAEAEAEAQDAARGFDLFQNTFECASCHGAAAEGGMGPTLAATRLSIDEVRRQVRAPSSRRMPAFPAEELPEEDLTAIYAYIRDLQPPTLADKATWWNIELLNLPTPAMPAHGDLEIHFGHRFSESLADAGFEGLYGLDSFAFPGFWFSYGLHERVAPYVGRTANFATWEYGLKIAILLEGQIGVPLSVAANIGGTYLDADGLPNPSRFTVEVPIGIRAGNRVALQVVPMFATNPDEFGAEESPGSSTALGFGGAFKLSTKFSLDGEYITNLGGYTRAGSVDQWQAGLTIHVRKHWFSLMLSNSNFTTPDFMVGGTPLTGIKSDVRFGFNLVRAFGF
jgi:mono/diheme cytochrome c family protein